MPAPFTWDSFAWDSTATWDGPANQGKTMNNTKAVIDFSNETDAGLGPVAQTIHDQMLLNAATFTAPPVTMAALLILITAYDAKLALRASRATLDVIAFNQARESLEDALGKLGNYVNTTANGDPMLVEKSGFPSYLTARSHDTTPPAAPSNLRLRHGELGGAITARYKADRSPSTNELQVNTGDPNNEAGWQTKGIFQGAGRSWAVSRPAR